MIYRHKTHEEKSAELALVLFFKFKTATFPKNNSFIYFLRNEQQPIEFCTVALPRIAAPNVSNTQTPREHSIERLEQVKSEQKIIKFCSFLSLSPIKPIIIILIHN